MMTGSVSTFADVALNFGAPAVRGDSVLRVANARGRRTVMYGDDTWLRLFPGLWAEFDGTTSFFVTDYTEVDNNVTRHLDKILTPDEQKKPTFDFLVLHYLGLDHIGHLEGARSPKIKPKLLEMDEVVKKIFTAMQKWDRNGVLIVCGDHGMRDAGGHGGATPSEVLVPLVLARSGDFVCPHPLGRGPTVAQVDVAPSVSWLLGCPFPGDSGGRLLPALLPQDTRQHLYLLHVQAQHNAKQALPTDTEFYKQFQRAEKQFAHYLATGQQSAAKIAREFYEDSLEKMSEFLTDTKTEFDMFAIGMAIVVLYLQSAAKIAREFYEDSLEKMSEFLTDTKTEFDMFAIGMAIVVLYLQSAAKIAREFYEDSLEKMSEFLTDTKTEFDMFAIGMAIVVLYLIATSLLFVTLYSFQPDARRKTSMTSHSHHKSNAGYIIAFLVIFSITSAILTTACFITETKSQVCHFTTVVVLLMYLSKKWTGATEVQEKPELAQRMSAVGVGILPKWVMLIALHRYLRTMNQTGDRWLFLPDTADWLNAPENAFYLQAHLVIGTIATLAICLYNLRYVNNVVYIQTGLTIAAVVCILCYRITSKALETPIDEIKTWDAVQIVSIFWAILIAQFILEILSYIGALKSCGLKPVERNATSANKFVYNKPKAKTEDYFYETLIEEPWNVDEVKLNLVRSISHLMLNDLMLIVVLLMRPHNVIMVPSIYITCVLTSECMDHKLLDSKSGKKTEVVDILSRTLVHMWIGILFFFYQGNSNSLSSVDLGSGYVGLREYCPVRVALRMGLHAYAGPAIAGAALFCTVAKHSDTWQQYLQTTWRATNILALHRVYSVVIYCVIATIFRDHLFVWSVFSPKLLYDFVATVFSVQALATIAQIEALAHITNWLARMFTYKSRL
ncbi:hypothetical protein B5X24_HaOG208621 [Helicoverpa armigera]|nr:hypothetical protein B5X24_HaOG208621 [Helicoverpa armigera]